jgi:hypothetical protein
VALVAEKLAPAVEEVCAALGVSPVFTDPDLVKFGLENSLLRLGDTFVELVAPVQGNTTAGRYLDKFGPGGYMILLQVPDLPKLEGVMNGMGLKLIYAGDRTMAMEDVPRKAGAQDKATAPGISGTHIHPRDAGCILSCDQQVPEEEWLWAGNEWLSKPLPQSTTTGGLAAVDVAVSDPGETAKTWSSLLALPMLTGGTHGVVLDGGATCVRFVNKRAGRKDDGVIALDVFSSDTGKIGTRVELCGVEVRFVQARAARSSSSKL